MQQLDTITKLKGLANHARLSHAHWLREARKGAIAAARAEVADAA
jgi:hypothetical protein